MVNQENVKRILMELDNEIERIEDYEEKVDAINLLESLVEILQMN